MTFKTPLIKNNRFDSLKSPNSNSFTQRRTRSYPSLKRISHNNNVLEGKSLRRTSSARFETRTNKKYKAPLCINNLNAFPILNEILPTKKECSMNYIAITKNLNKTETDEKDKVKEGWVRLTKKNNKIITEYGYQKENVEEEEEDYHDRAQKHIYKLVVRWQKERDEKNELLLDMSPYWNEPSLLEPLDEDLDDDTEEEYDDN